jgi:hypothetical protein
MAYLPEIGAQEFSGVTSGTIDDMPLLVILIGKNVTILHTCSRLIAGSAGRDEKH